MSILIVISSIIHGLFLVVYQTQVHDFHMDNTTLIIILALPGNNLLLDTLATTSHIAHRTSHDHYFHGMYDPEDDPVSDASPCMSIVLPVSSQTKG